ncbi:MAG TPA: alkaline phosphatase family protein [Streptosporangiaceae bacterium]
MQIGHLLRHSAPRLLPRRMIAAGAAIPLTLGLAGAAAGPHAGFQPPPVKHVWFIELENEGYKQTFGDPSADPYLATTLPGMGALLTNYYAVGHDSLDNYVAQVSGQSPDFATMNDCGIWTRFQPANHVVTPYGQLAGNGCVYPAAVRTLGNQLTGAHFTWKAYQQDMGNLPARDHTTETTAGPACGHPAVGTRDDTESAVPADQYAARHEGFMYFESVIGDRSYCEQHIVSFRPLLHDLTSAARTPAYSWITPNLCFDGHDAPCVTGEPGGLTEIDAFLRIWIPQIMNSPAYQQDGLIIITFDEGTTSQACCGETAGRSPSHPNVAEPGMTGPGGGRVGAIAISRFIKPGTVSAVDYNHYSSLRSVEDIFGLAHLGDAAMPQVKPFGPDVYTSP